MKVMADILTTNFVYSAGLPDTILSIRVMLWNLMPSLWSACDDGRPEDFVVIRVKISYEHIMVSCVKKSQKGL